MAASDRIGKPRKRGRMASNWTEEAYDWAGLLAELRRGKSILQLLGRPRFPTRFLIMSRLEHDPDFAALAGPFIRKKVQTRTPDEAGFTAVLEGLRAGQPLRSMVGKKGYATDHHWARRLAADPALAAEVHRLRRYHHSAESWAAVLKAAVTAKSITALGKLPGLPDEGTIRSRMKRDPEFDAAIRSRMTIQRKNGGRERVEAAVQAIEAGATLKDLANRPNLPHAVTIRKYLKADPVLGDRVGGLIRGADPSGKRFRPVDYERALTILQAGSGSDALRAARLPALATVKKYGWQDKGFGARFRQTMRAHGSRQAQARGGLSQSLSQLDLYRAVDRAIPDGLDQTVREDLRAEMILAVLEGDIEAREVTRATARAFLADYNRSAGTWQTSSLDAPVGEGGRTLHDVFAG